MPASNAVRSPLSFTRNSPTFSPPFAIPGRGGTPILVTCGPARAWEDLHHHAQNVAFELRPCGLGCTRRRRLLVLQKGVMIEIVCQIVSLHIDGDPRVARRQWRRDLTGWPRH